MMALKRDGRLAFVDEPGPGDLVVHAELLNAYISQALHTEKSATVVFRARFERGGKAAGEEIIRGHFDTLNWFSTSDEILGIFNRAMQDALGALDRTIIARCAA